MPAAKKSPKLKSRGLLLVRLGRAIKRHRLILGISQAELARRSKKDRTIVGFLERGEANVSVLKLAEIARQLGVSAASLMGEAENAKD